MNKFCLGLMSGTSMDGIDAALIQTDGHEFIESIASAFYPYPAVFRKCLKLLEYIVKKSEGDFSLAAQEFNQLALIHDNELIKLFNEFNCNPINIANTILISTLYHSQAALNIIQQNGYSNDQIEVIGYHGQTLYHAPDRQITLQVGDAQLIANQLNIPVVTDFRSNDITHGGQGAPLVPIYHWVLAKHNGLIPVAVLNCGGIANITFVTDENPENLVAFDTGPGNVLLDRFVREKTFDQHFFDLDGKWALKGQINTEAFASLDSVALPANFLTTPPPKSLDSYDCHLPPIFQELSLEDGCATLAAFSAECMVRAQDWTKILPSRWILAGGGWYNPVIMSEFKTRLDAKIKQSAQIVTAKQLGWQQDTLEAEAFAYLAKRSVLNLPLSFPGTTGVTQPLTGGKLFTV